MQCGAVRCGAVQRARHATVASLSTAPVGQGVDRVCVLFAAYCVPQLHDLLAPTALSLPTERSAIISATLPVALYIVCRIKALFLLHSKLCLWCRALHPVVADAAFRIVQPRTLHGVQCIVPTLRSQIDRSDRSRPIGSGTLQPSAAMPQECPVWP